VRALINAVDNGITVFICPSWLKTHDHASLSNQLINQRCQRQNETNAEQREIHSRTKRAGIKIFVDIIKHELPPIL
jgi:hypothetical protein